MSIPSILDRKDRTRGRAGFTLIEIMVVVAIIGLLLTFVAPNVWNRLREANVTGTKAKGVKTTEDRFALSVSDVLNEMAAEGWEYVRAETLPCEERKGLTGRETRYQNVLIFKRFQSEPLPLEGETVRIVSRPSPQLVPDPAPAEPAPVRSAPVSVDPVEPGPAPRLGAATDD